MSHTSGPWTAEIARQAKDAPAFGFAVKAVGRVPFVASAGVATPDHNLIIAEPFRKLVTTGFTPEEVQANGYLIAAAPDLLAALKALMDIQDSTDDCWCEESRPQTCEACQARAAIAKAEGATTGGPQP